MCDSNNMSEWWDLAKKAASKNSWADAVEMLTNILDELKSKEKEREISGEEIPTSDGLLPSRAMILQERADMYLQIGNAQKCVKDAKDAVRLEPGLVRGFCLLSAAFLQMKLYGHAEVQVKKGLKIDAKNEELKQRLKELQNDEERYPAVRGRDGSDRKLRNLQNRTGQYMDVNQYPDIVKGIMVGDVAAVKSLWCPKHLNVRITELKTPIIAMPVLGRQRVTQRGSKGPAKDYCDMIDFLFEQGARLDHCDKVGYTALMHAAGHAMEPELLDHLLKKGADPNVQSVYGTVALTDACMAQNEKIVDMLLRYGADPNIPDNDNMTPLQFVRPFKKLVAVFDKHLNDETITRVCMNCDSRSGISRCTGCRYVFYCSKECQLEQWSSHKRQCKSIKKSHMRLKVIPGKPGTKVSLISNTAEMLLNNISSTGYEKPKMKPKFAQFESKAFEEFEKSWKKGGNILKLQINREDPENGEMLVYNKDKDLCFQACPLQLNGPNVVNIIKKKGVKGIKGIKENGVKGVDDTFGLKGYFLCFVDKPEEIVIITDPMLPAQPW